MVYRLLILVLIFNVSIGYSNVIFNKKNISITDIEMNSYKKIYKDNYGQILSDNKALKEIFLIKKTINFLIDNNSEFIKSIDNKINLEFSQNIFKNEILLNFFRFNLIKNEFINDYFQNKFDVEDLELIFNSIDELILPLSKNECLTIEKLQDVTNDKNFIFNYYENIKKNSKDFKTKINNITYNVCKNDKNFKILENQILKFIENKTSGEFDEFIYGKIN